MLIQWLLFTRTKQGFTKKNCDSYDFKTAYENGSKKIVYGE